MVGRGALNAVIEVRNLVPQQIWNVTGKVGSAPGALAGRER